MSHHFLAMMNRMRYINRWGLMRNTQTENIQEHSLQVVMITHALLEIRASMFYQGRQPLDKAQTLLLALYHDAAEILTGDLPTPVKYANPAIRDAYHAVETVAAEKLLSLLPEALLPAYRPLFLPDQADAATTEAVKLVKAADRLSAYIKCLEEEKAGNSEFRQASETVRQKLALVMRELPEVAWFMEQLLPSFLLSLDELS
ncbi:MAG: 5'-deoxynucleotidase [Ruminococcaceae bacterium]|nr:5'-deoxynucleotidase [Oscillospiraceae bacterium]